MGLDIGSLHVRRSILIAATPSCVWQEFTDFERVHAWLGRGHTLHRLELSVGGTAELSVEINGEERYFGGSVLVLEPERELSFESNWHPPHQWPVPTRWTIRLTPVDGGTLVELFHHGFEGLGARAADELQGYEQGWDVKHLVALRAIVEAGA